MRVHDYLDFHASRSPNAEFAICSGKRLTYGEAREQANGISRALIGSGAKPGDRVAILQMNSVETILLCHGALKAGMVPTPINYRLLPSDWLRICQNAEAKIFVCDAEFVPEVDKIRSQLKSVHFFIMTLGNPLPGWANFEDWAGAHDRQPPNVQVDEQNDAFQLYTSGTTGPPKAAVLTHARRDRKHCTAEGSSSVSDGRSLPTGPAALSRRGNHRDAAHDFIRSLSRHRA